MPMTSSQYPEYGARHSWGHHGGVGDRLREARLNQLRLDLFFVTVGADAMAKMDIGIGRNVILDALPVVLIVPYLFAVAADRQQAAEVLDLRQGGLQLAHAFLHIVPQLDDAHAGLQAGE